MENLILKTSEQSKQTEEKSKEKQPSFGTVVSYAAGKATIIIDGDTASDGVAYECAQSCIPIAGDRVFFARTGSTLVILCVIKNAGLHADTAIDFSGRHTGSTVAFFGGTPAVKELVLQLSTSATLAQVITKVNQINSVLTHYGLFD
jgi:hypothetical protein